jgi:AcrR family transcriptional regulator
MTHSLRERRRQMLRDEILDAALALLTERGYAAMSMDDLAARAGISKPTLYNHFTTKDDIVVASAVRGMDRVIALIEGGVESRTPLERLATLLRAVLQLKVDEGTIDMRGWAPELFQLLCTRSELLERLGRIDGGVVSMVEEGIANGEIDPNLSPAAVLRSYYALTSALSFAPPWRDDGLDPAAAIDTIVALFVRGVRPAGA